MPVSSTALLIIGGIATGLLIGHLLYLKAGAGGGRLLSALSSAVGGLLWTLVGVFAVIGGYYLTGVVLIAIASYMARSNAREVDRRTSIRTRIAGGR